MATSFTFNNQVVELPGSYSRFVSNVTNPPLSLSYGNVLLIDNGIGAGFGAGAGISGTLASGADAIYGSDSLKVFRDAIGGGIIWDIAEKIFQPNGPGGGNGASTVFYARSAATTPAEVTIDFTAGAAGGTSIVQAKNEGLVGNGAEGDQTLSNTTALPITVTVAGSAADTHTINVTDPIAGITAIGTFAVVGGETVTEIAQALVISINTGTSGYTATSTGADIYVTSRNPIGLEEASDFDGIVNTYDGTGTADGTAGTFAGAVDGTKLTRGYSATMSAGNDDPDAFIVKFWRGTYKGLDSNGLPWDGALEADTFPVLIAQSEEFIDINDFHNWMETDLSFGSIFKLTTKTVVGVGTVVTADLSANASNNLFSGGTEIYSTTELDKVLEQVQGLNYSLVIADGYADNAQSVDNGKILAHLAEPETFGDKMMVVGGGEDASTFKKGVTNSSVETAISYNTDRVIVCHGGPIKNTNYLADGFVPRTSLHKAAVVVGRIAGLAPQIPITFKTLGIDGERHQLSKKEQKQGLNYGVLMSISDRSLFRCVQGVNSIQDNSFLVNPNGSTHSIQLRRMMAQISTELEVNATEQLLKNPDGTNRNTLSASDVKTFTEGYLRSRTASTTVDNMVLSFRNVNVVTDNDAYKVSYDIVFNTEITKIFFTGTIYLSF